MTWLKPYYWNAGGNHLSWKASFKNTKCLVSLRQDIRHDIFHPSIAVFIQVQVAVCLPGFFLFTFGYSFVFCEILTHLWLLYNQLSFVRVFQFFNNRGGLSENKSLLLFFYCILKGYKPVSNKSTAVDRAVWFTSSVLRVSVIVTRTFVIYCPYIPPSIGKEL